MRPILLLAAAVAVTLPLAAHAQTVGIGDRLADRILDHDVVGHQRQPAVAVVGLHAPP